MQMCYPIGVKEGLSYATLHTSTQRLIKPCRKALDPPEPEIENMSRLSEHPEHEYYN